MTAIKIIAFIAAGILIFFGVLGGAIAFGFIGVFIKEEYGGAGMDYTALAVALEERGTTIPETGVTGIFSGGLILMMARSVSRSRATSATRRRPAPAGGPLPPAPGARRRRARRQRVKPAPPRIHRPGAPSPA